jgi:hypothetical protein
VGRDVAVVTTANPSSSIKLLETGGAHAERLVRDVAEGTFRPPGEVPGELAAVRFRPDRDLARRIEAGVRRDGELRAAHFWRTALLMNWTGGTLKLYLPRLRQLFAGTPVRDIGLLASEGRFSIPLADETASGVADITAGFLEFIPAASRGADPPPALRAHEVAVGEEYFLVVTNRAGLWRYDLDDRVRVTDFLGRSCVFEFLSRGARTANITGEKITEHQVVEAMHRACGASGAAVERFVVQGRFAATPYYELRLEAADGRAAEALAGAMDAALGELNVEYASKRRSGRLGAMRAAVLAEGSLARAEADAIRSRGNCEQFKPTYLLTEVLPVE